MIHLFHITPLLFLLASGIAAAKGFTISASPATQSVNAGQTVTFNVTVVPIDGFDASVFLRIYSTTLNSANAVLAPLKLDLGTYTSGATLTASPTKIDVGSHEIVIEGRNGDVLVYDTVTLTVSPAPGDNQWTVYHMANSGLPSPLINTITFDTSGAAWIATRSGLARAELGEEPEFVNSPFGTSSINALAVDGTNTLWAVGADSVLHGGLKLARYSNGEWVDVPLGVHSSHLHSATMAATPDGSIWFGGYEALIRLKDTVWTKYYPSHWGGGPPRIMSITVSTDGDLWGISERVIDDMFSNVFRYDGSFWTGYKLSYLGLKTDRDWGFVAAADSNNIWVLAGGKIASPRGTNVLNRSVPADAVWLATARNGRLWAASYRGAGGPVLYRSDDNGWKPYPLDSSGIGRDAQINKLLVHRNGSVWVGTSHGLAILWAGSDTGSVGGGTSSVVRDDLAASVDCLSITPNPLGSQGSLSLATKGGSARITLHDNLGREVMTLFDGVLAPGQQTLPVDLSSLPVGAYLLSVEVDGATPSTRMIVVAR